MRINEPAVTGTQNCRKPGTSTTARTVSALWLEAADWLKVKRLLETPLQHQVEQNTPKGWDSVSQEAVYALSLKPTHRALSLTASIHDPEFKGWK